MPAGLFRFPGISMKVITVWQPWASLIAIGAKPYEFRGWVPPSSVVDTRIGIHAAARKIRPSEVNGIISAIREAGWRVCLDPEKALPLLEKVLADPDCLPLSAIVATAMLGWPESAEKVATRYGAPAVNDSDREEHFNYAWPMRDVQPLLPPIEAKGMQGFWNHGGTL